MTTEHNHNGTSVTLPAGSLSEWRKAQLQEAADALGLDTSGGVDELRNRLRQPLAEHIASLADQPEPPYVLDGSEPSDVEWLCYSFAQSNNGRISVKTPGAHTPGGRGLAGKRNTLPASKAAALAGLPRNWRSIARAVSAWVDGLPAF